MVLQLMKIWFPEPVFIWLYTFLFGCFLIRREILILTFLCHFNLFVWACEFYIRKSASDMLGVYFLVYASLLLSWAAFALYFKKKMLLFDFHNSKESFVVMVFLWVGYCYFPFSHGLTREVFLQRSKEVSRGRWAFWDTEKVRRNWLRKRRLTWVFFF